MPINIDGITIDEDGTITGRIIDFKPVRHGHWLAVKGWDDAIGEIDSVECSVCHDTQDSEYWAKTYFHYCPNCGAKMDGEETR